MSKMTDAIRDELAAFFDGGNFATGLAAQTYEPRGGDRYTPMTDTRLVRLVVAGQHHAKSDWARVKRVIDDLSTRTVEILRLGRYGTHAIACQLPAAREVGRRFAQELSREFAVELEYDAQRRVGTTGILLAMRVLDAEAAERRRHSHVSAFELENAVRRVIELGLVDVDAEAERVLDEAVDAYVAARSALHATKRGHKARLRKENEAQLDHELGKTTRRRQRARERIERALPGGLEAIAEGVARIAS